MKLRIHMALLFLAMATGLGATTPELTLVTLPICSLGDQDGTKVHYVETPMMVNHNLAFVKVPLFSTPVKAHGKPEDLNLISVYGIVPRVVGDSFGKELKVRLDVSGAKRPKRYPFTIEQVGAFAAKALRMEFKEFKKVKVFLSDGEKELKEL